MVSDAMNVAFANLKAKDFPFKIEWLNAAGEVVHEVTVDSPGVVPVPGLAKDHGPVSVRMTMANGDVITDQQ